MEKEVEEEEENEEEKEEEDVTSCDPEMWNTVARKKRPVPLYRMKAINRDDNL